MASGRRWPLETWICVVLFVAAAALHLVLSTIGWNHTLLGPHSFRQAQTAISTYYFVQDGVSLNYITPILGPPWQIPLEFPLFQACTAWLVNATGLDLDVAGRLMSWLFFISLLPAGYLLLDRFRVSPPRRLIFLALLILSPIYIFFSRSFMIESAALSLAAWFLVCFDRFLTRPRAGWFIGALILGGLAGAVKITTFAVFLIAALLLLIGSLRTPGTSRFQGWLRAGLSVGGPMILACLWLVHATIVRHRNPEAAFLDEHFGFWSFGDLAQRLSPSFWAKTFRVWSGEILSEAGIILIVLYYGFLAGRYRSAVTGCLVTFLSGQLIFSNLYFVHSYYFYASGLFLVAALGFALAEVVEHPALSLRTQAILITAVLGFQVSAYSRTYYDFQRTNKPIPEAVAVLNSISEPDDIIIIIGQDWNSSFPYYAERRALMLPTVRANDLADVSRTIKRLDPQKVAAIVVDGAHWRDGEFVHAAFSPVDPGPHPLLYVQDLGIWIPRMRHSAVREEFDSRRFPSFSITADENPTGQPRTLLARQIQRRAEFKMFQPRPIRATSVNDFSVAMVNLHEVITAHATTELVFQPASPTRQISAVYGINEGAYSGKDSTDGVEFVVSARQSDGSEQPLFQRLLDPQRAAGDRGSQTLDLKVEVPPDTEIIFRTLPGPANSNSFDWAYWGGITLK